MTLLQVEAVAKHRGGRPVLRGVDFSVPAKAVVALLGPSGCGKTTLLRVIAGFEAAEQGRVALDGRVLQGPAQFVPAERRRIGYVPQEGTLFPHLTVAGNVGFGLTRAERRAGRIAEALQLTGLAELERRYPHQLSGGQQQRTALARALAPRPAMVLLDEPFAGLDLALRRSVCADVVALLRRHAATAVLVTHDPHEAFASADLVAVMQDGRIAQCAGPETVYRCPASVAVARLTGGVVLLDGIAQGGQARTALGVLELQPHAAGNGPVQVLVRPEQISRTAPEQGVALRILHRVFRGDYTLATLTDGAEQLELPLSLQDGAPDLLHLRVDGACTAFAAERCTVDPVRAD